MKYEEVPNIISGKDLNYLSDMFEWNYGPYKCMSDSIGKVSDDKIASMLEKGAKLFDENMNEILDILGGNYE